MSDPQKMEQEKNVLRWGGLAGILGSILFVAGWVIVGVGPVGMDEPADLAGWVTRFPDIQAARVPENLVYLTALILEIPFYLALYRALQRTRLAPALFGCALGILGLVSMAVGATPHVAHAPLSELYRAPGTTPADQASLALMWQATRGIFDAMLYVGFYVVPIGLFLLGLGMLGTPAFGKVLGWVSVALGVVGFVAAVLQMADPASMIGAVSYFAGLIFYLVVGIKVYRLSRTA